MSVCDGVQMAARGGGGVPAVYSMDMPQWTSATACLLQPKGLLQPASCLLHGCEDRRSAWCVWEGWRWLWGWDGWGV